MIGDSSKKNSWEDTSTKNTSKCTLRVVSSSHVRLSFKIYFRLCLVSSKFEWKCEEEK